MADHSEMFSEEPLDPTVRESAPLESSGQIGPYRLLQRVGQGGMGEVWLADQSEPIRRRVALKVIKPGMDSSEVVARFEAERQALALMNHPFVAKVHDAGTTPGGRPFFVMEYVPGVPITEYCDRHAMGLGARLELVQKVCEGVQHAHHKAIIHRDLKPGNVLVMEQDGVPQPKIIDFGVAKATSQKLTEQTMFTQLGVLIGTPEYMSPEQAELTGEDVDTRTDVYSLGVILYELIAGALPFEPTELRKAGFDGIRQVIREQIPPRPSERASAIISESSKDVPRWFPRDLEGELSGDLDWITLKALEKDRGRRYDSPTALARDIGRHLTNQPVEARPPTLSYRIGRFVRRNRLGVVFATVVSLILIGSGVSLAVLYARSLEAERVASREAATAEEALTFMTGLFEASNPFNLGEEPPTARELLETGAARLEDLDDQPVVQVKLMGTMATVFNEIGDWEKSRQLLESAIAVQSGLAGPRDLTVADLQFRLAHNRNLAEDYDVAEEVLRECLSTREALLGLDSKGVADVWHQLAFGRVRRDQYEEGEQFSRKALTALEEVERAGDGGAADYLFIFAWSLAGQGKIEEASENFERSLELRREQIGYENPATGWTLNMYGWMLARQSDPEQIRRGIALLDDAYELNDRLFDGYHVELAYNRNNASEGYHNLGDDVTAEAYAREAVSIASNFLDDRGSLGGMKIRWARHLAALGREAEAKKVLSALLESLESHPEAKDRWRAAREALTEIEENKNAGAGE